MKSFKQHIIEAKQVGILYHYTSLYGLLRILQDNKIHRGKFSYVSLTRDKFFHKHGRLDYLVRFEPLLNYPKSFLWHLQF